MHKPKENPGLYFNILHQKRVAELLLAAIRFDLFSYLESYTSPKAVSLHTSLNERNLQLVLNALSAAGFLEKSGEQYRNTTQSNEFLNKASAVYIGETILYREKMMSLSNLEERLKNGPDQIIQSNNKGVDVYDFYEAARVGIPEMYTGRVQSFVRNVKEVFCLASPQMVLDLGGGNGVMTMELLEEYPACRGVIFEHPSVAQLPRQLAAERKLTNRIEVREGDFNLDHLGTGYDLILASGILDFAKDHLEELMGKLAKALTPEGILYLVTNEITEDFQAPPQSILGWLSSHLDGLDLLLSADTIKAQLMKHNFVKVNVIEIDGAYSSLQGEFYRKGSTI